LREYIADRFTNAPLALTSTELLSATRDARTLPHDRLMRILNEADLVKFAKRPVSADRARDMGQEARALVEYEPEASPPAAAAGVVALARPRSGAREENTTSQGINIVIAIDLSSSMLAQDFQPQNRLEVAKETVKRFIAARTADRIGIVAFAAEALTQVPLTTDYPVVSSAVDNLAPGQLEDGTAIGTALATAANRLRTAQGRSKVIILLTDGENNRGEVDPRTAGMTEARLE